MKYRWDKKYLYWGFTAFIVIAVSICFYYLLFHGSSLSHNFFRMVSIVMPVIDGLVVAYLLTPVMNFIEKRLLLPLIGLCKEERIREKLKKRMRVVSILLTLIVVVLFFYGFFSMVIPQLIISIQSIMLQFPIYINNLSNWVTRLLVDNPNIENFVNDMLSTYSMEMERWMNQSLLPKMNEVLMTLSLSLLSFLKATWNLIIGVVISIYLLSSKELFSGQCKKFIYAAFEVKTANSIIDALRFTHKTFIGFIGGKIIDSIIIGIICFVCTSFIGTPYPVLVSVIVGVTNVIPFFGPYLGAIPSAILILLVNPIQCLYFIIFIIFLQQFDGNILGPKILGNSTGLSGFWVIFAITFFGGLWGILGMLVGVPIFAVLLAGFKSLCNRQLKKRGLATDTALYTQVYEIKGKEFIPKKEPDYDVKTKPHFWESRRAAEPENKRSTVGNSEENDKKQE